MPKCAILFCQNNSNEANNHNCGVSYHGVHMCHRWTGGSHTLTGAAAAVGRETAQRPLPLPPPAKRYIGVGDDGRAYRLARDLEPCVECNQMIPGAAEVAEAAVAGAGDQVTVVTVDDAKRTVVDGDALAQPAESDGDAGPRRSTFGAGANTPENRRTTLGPVGSVVQGRITAVDPAAVLQAAARHEAAVRRAEREATRASRAEAAGTTVITEAAADAENAAAAEHGAAPAAEDVDGDKGDDGEGKKGDDGEGNKGDEGDEGADGGNNGNEGDDGPPSPPLPDDEAPAT